MRVWRNPFTPEHEAAINEVLISYREGLMDDFRVIFDEIEIKLTEV